MTSHDVKLRNMMSCDKTVLCHMFYVISSWGNIINLIHVMFVMYVCVCLCPSCQKDYRAKGLCMRGTREVHECSGVFID